LTPFTISTSASEGSSDAHRATSDFKLIDRLRDLLSDINDIKRALLEFSNRRLNGLLIEVNGLLIEVNGLLIEADRFQGIARRVEIR